jgi:hypothetical protein
LSTVPENTVISQSRPELDWKSSLH